MEDLSRHELLALKEIHRTGEALDKGLVRKFVQEKLVVDIGSLLIDEQRTGLVGARFASAVE